MKAISKFKRGLSVLLGIAIVASSLVFSSVATAGAETTQNFASVPRANGSFVQSWMCNSWSDERWATELQSMKDAGFEYLIVADIANKAKSSDGGKWTTYYPSTLPELSGSNLATNYGDVIEKALRNCKAKGMKVFVGMGGYDDWWTTGGMGSDFKNFSVISAKIAEEVYNKYYSRYQGTFYGWYFVPEIQNNYLNTTPYKGNLAEGLNTVLAKITQLNPSLPFLMSPYFNEYYTALSVNQTKNFWSDLFSRVNFRSGDIFCPQDAVGAGYVSSISNMENVMKMYKEVVDGSGKGVKLWANCENFTEPHDGGLMGPPKTENTTFITSTLDRFVQQMETASKYAENIITFSYNHYYSPHYVRPVFYNTYMRYIQSGKLENEKPVASQIKTELQSNGSLKISWNDFYDNIGVAFYRVYKNGTMVCRNDTDGMNLSKEYIDSSFSATGKTVYEVEAIDAAGNISDRAKLTVDGADPNNYVDLTSTARYKEVCGFEQVPAGIKPGVNDTAGYFAPLENNDGSDFVLQVADGCGFAGSRGLQFGVKSTSVADPWISTRIYPPAFSNTSAQGADTVYFWIDTTNMTNGNHFSHQFYVSEHDNAGNETTLWSIKTDSPVYIENGCGGFNKLTSSGSTIIYPESYKGMVKIPYSSLMPIWGTTDANGKMGLDSVEYIMIAFNSWHDWAGGNVTFDCIGFSGQLQQQENPTAANTCDFSNVPLGTKPDLSDTNGYFTSTAQNANFGMEITNQGIDGSNGLTYSVPATATANQWVSCKINAPAFNSTSASGCNQIRFWVDTTNLKSNDHFAHLLYFTETNPATNVETVWGLKANSDYFVQDGSRLRTLSSDGEAISYPIGYKGYISVSMDSFEPKFGSAASSSPVLSNINNLWLAFNSWQEWAGSNVTFDAFCFGVTANSSLACFVKSPARLAENVGTTFGVLSDIHLSADPMGTDYEEDNLRNALTKFKENNIKVLMVAGDFTNKGEEGSYQKFTTIFNEVFDNEASRPEKVFCMGNHDFWDGVPSTNVTRFENLLGTSANRHITSNGYHFISLSTENSTTNGSFGSSKLSWLREQLTAAQADDPNKPIFVTTHQPAQNTVYGSEEWGNTQIGNVLKDFPQAINFSGHSHFVLDDERSIHQGDFTSVGTSTLSYTELESGKTNGSLPPRNREVAQGLIVKVNASAVNIKRWDFHSDLQIKDDWVIPTPIAKSDFIYTNARANSRVAPVFPANAKVNTITSQTTASFTFTAAIHDDLVHSYRLQILNKDTGATVSDTLAFSDFYLGVQRMSPVMTMGVEGLTANTDYTAKIYAIESFGKQSAPLTQDFSTDSVPGEDILNVNFAGGSAADTSSYNSAYELKNGAQIATDSSLGKSVLTLNGTNYANYTMNDTQLGKIANSFTLETAFKMNSVKNQAIIENCEGGGLGFESDANGYTQLWAYIGGSYKKVGVQLQANTYYHLLATYNGSKIKLYLNGELVDSLATTGSLSGTSSVAMCLGGDPGANGSATLLFDGNIALARVSSNAINATEAKYRYEDFLDQNAEILDVDFSDGTAFDHSDFASPVSFSGNVSITNDPALGKNVAVLDGNSSYINYQMGNRQCDLMSKSFTIEAVFKMNSIKNQCILQNTQSSGMGFESTSTGFVELWAYINGSFKTVGVQLQAGQYYYLTGTYDGATLKLYSNGVLAASLATSGTLTHNSQIAMCIGGDPDFGGYAYHNLDGNVALARISSKAMDAATVQQRYNSFFGL